jgi:methylmalonyl-CoA mutase N-terminal domain/subunit
MTTWSTDLDAETARRLAAQERELAQLRAEVAAWRAAAAALPTRTDTDFTSVSGRSVELVYTPLDVPPGLQAATDLPGEYPFTRGIHPTMYRGRLWTMRQFAGFGTAEETNERFRYLLEHGQTGLSVAFDLPTQLGLDSDDPLAHGEVGRTGVAVDSIDDMRVVFDGIPLDRVSTSMTINAPASLLLLLYELAAEEQGIAGDQLRGTVQNDILKEYVARGNYIFPPRPSMRVTTDLFAYCAERLPQFNTISISGYHIREAGSTAVQELAFTVANGIAYCQAAVDAGLSPDDFGERVSFFFNAHNDFLQEVAKFRAARRLWARVMRDRFGATNPKAMALRFHAQTGGSTLTAQQPENNIVRVAIQALSAVLGGAQSLHTNSFDEALALPTEHAARIALRTQQVLQHEMGLTLTADPLGGSYFIESLTDELEREAWALVERVDELGGAVAAIEQGFVQHEIEDSAYADALAVEQGGRTVVGVNDFAEDGGGAEVELQRIDPEIERRQLERTARLRAARDPAAAGRALADVRSAAEGTGNLLVPMREALRARCTIGEICGELRTVFGMFDA